MQTTHKISGDSAAGYANYLTSSSDRGDYYAGGDEGEEGGGAAALAPSRWHGSPALLADLGLAADRPVGRDEFAALMQGVSPADGRELRRAGGDGSRVAGIDMTFSAPKSVSALWAVSSPYERARIEAAHSRAVAGTLAAWSVTSSCCGPGSRESSTGSVPIGFWPPCSCIPRAG